MIDLKSVKILQINLEVKMLDQVIVTYCICDEVTKALNIKDDIQCKMSSAEIMTFVLMSATIYGCNYQRTRLIACVHHYFPKILSISQLVRRIVSP